MLVHMPSLVFCLPWLRDRNPRAGAEGMIKRWLAGWWHWRLANQLPVPSRGGVSHPLRISLISLTNLFPAFPPSLPALGFDSNSEKVFKPVSDFKSISSGFKCSGQPCAAQRLLGLHWQHHLCFESIATHQLLFPPAIYSKTPLSSKHFSPTLGGRSPWLGWEKHSGDGQGWMRKERRSTGNRLSLPSAGSFPLMSEQVYIPTPTPLCRTSWIIAK